MAKFISLFAGVGGFDLGMEKAGHECVAQVEWDKNAAGVLKHRWPNVPLFCDVSKVSAEDLPDCDFITYGFPCQDVSQAGLRKGLDGKRSGLFFEACRLIKQLAERAIRRGGVGGGRFIALAENVSGLLSSGDGYDFARCIRELHKIGSDEVGWTVLDTQHVGWREPDGRIVRAAPQRRKRVFICATFGHFGEGTAGEIFSQQSRLQRYFKKGRETGKGTAGDATKGVGEGGEQVICRASDQAKAETSVDQAPTLNSNHGVGGQIVAHGADVYNGQVTGETSATVTSATGIANASGPKVMEQKETVKAIPIHDMATRHAGKRGEKSDGKGNGLGVGQEGDPSPTLTKGDHHAVVSWNGDTTPKASEDVSVTLRSQQGGEGVGVAFHASQDPIHSEEHSPALGSNATIGVAFTASDRSNKAAWEGEISGTINCQMNSESSNLQMGVRENLTVRRLTPIECERLQGFPDDWTAEKMELTLEGNEWKATGKVVKQADGPRYKAMGNAVTVNVAEWIGKQIGKVL